MTAALILGGCRAPEESGKGTIYVSIAPLKYFVEQIADTAFMVRVLVPETTSPETFEPTVQQIRRLAGARTYIAVGLIDFENELAGSVRNVAPDINYLDLSEGVEIIAGSCRHDHSADGHHSHPADPHIWLSPRIVKDMAQKIARQLVELDPAREKFFYARLDRFLAAIDSLDDHIRSAFDSSGRRAFAIGHPSLTYYAHDYGLEQISVEADGKEPGALKMKEIVDLLKSKGIATVLTQKQTTAAAAEAVARELGGEAVLFDPLAEEWLGNMYYVTSILQDATR